MLSSSSTISTGILGSVFGSLMGRSLRVGWGGGRRCRPLDREPGAFAGTRVDGDGGAVLADDLLHDVQAEAGPLAGPLRGEEGLEQAGPNLVGDARALVVDDEAHAARRPVHGHEL